jgi:hypothetical protein
MMMIIIIICKTLGIETTENWYSHTATSVTEREDITDMYKGGLTVFVILYFICIFAYKLL